MTGIDPPILEVDIESIVIDEAFKKKLPPMPARQFEAFKADIDARTMRVPVLLSRDNLLLDGHRRYDAAKALGLKTIPGRILNVRGTSWEDAILDHVNRKHLTAGQLAAMGTSLERIERERAKDRQGTRTDLGQHLENGSPDVEAGRATEKVAEQLGISRKTYEQTRTVLEEGDEETKKKLLAASMSVKAAYKKTQEQQGKAPPEPTVKEKARAELVAWRKRYDGHQELASAIEWVAQAIDELS